MRAPYLISHQALHPLISKPNSFTVLFNSQCSTTAKMPIPILAEVSSQGLSSIPFVMPVLKTVPWLFLIWLVKLFFAGASNSSERLMKSKVVIITVRHTSKRPCHALAVSHGFVGRYFWHWSCSGTRLGR